MTAGSILTEQRLRAYIKCSEFFAFGGEEDLSLHNQILRATFRQIVSLSIRKQRNAEEFDVHKILLRQVFVHTRDLLEPQSVAIRNKLVLALTDLAQIFPFDRYYPVYGSLPLEMKVSKTLLRLETSGVFRRTDNKTIHVVTWVPYVHDHAHMNDPCLHLKLHVFKSLVKNRFGAHRARIHQFSLSDSGNLSYYNLSTQDVDPKFTKQIKSLVKAMESDFHFPSIPCLRACPFKEQCQPLSDTPSS